MVTIGWNNVNLSVWRYNIL